MEHLEYLAAYQHIANLVCGAVIKKTNVDHSIEHCVFTDEFDKNIHLKLHNYILKCSKYIKCRYNSNKMLSIAKYKLLKLYRSAIEIIEDYKFNNVLYERRISFINLINGKLESCFYSDVPYCITIIEQPDSSGKLRETSINTHYVKNEYILEYIYDGNKYIYDINEASLMLENNPYKYEIENILYYNNNDMGKSCYIKIH